MSLEFQKLQDIYFINQNLINEYPVINKQFLFWLDPNQFKINNVENFISTIEKNLKLLEQINFKIRMNEVEDTQLIKFIKSQMQFNEIPMIFEKLKIIGEINNRKDNPILNKSKGLNSAQIESLKNELIRLYERQVFYSAINKRGYIESITKPRLYIDLDFVFHYSFKHKWHNGVDYIDDIETNQLNLKSDIKMYLNISNPDSYGVKYFFCLRGIFESLQLAVIFKEKTLSLKQLIS